MGFSHALFLLNIITILEVSGYYFFSYSHLCSSMTSICILHVSLHVFCECKDILMAKESTAILSLKNLHLYLLCICV